MTDLDTLCAALASGDGSAFLGLADALAEDGHPDAPELCDLAITIMTSEDWAVVHMAANCFLMILETRK